MSPPAVAGPSNGRRKDIIIEVPKSIFGTRRRNPRESRRAQAIQEMLNEKDSGSALLYSFKRQPSSVPDETETRPLPKCCQICIPEADTVIHDDMKLLGVSDCFIPPTTSPYNSAVCRILPLYTYYASWVKYPDVLKLPSWNDLEKDPNLWEMFGGSTKVDKSTKTEVLSIMCQLQVKNAWKSFHNWFIRLTTWLCQKYLSRHFESVLVHSGQIELLREVHSKNLPVIYIPTYRSDFDTTLIMWTLAHNGFKTPLFIRDHKSKNWLLKYFGGIGAALEVHAGQKSEKRYSAALSVYFQHVLRQGNNFVLRMERGRSRCGRSTANIYGTELLRLILDEFESNKIEDVYFVPVSVSYEVVPDEKEIIEGIKSSAASNGLFSSITSFLRALLLPNKNVLKGKVKIDFCQPACLRELYNSLNRNLKIRRLTQCKETHESYSISGNCSYLRWGSQESLNSVCSLYGELAPLYPHADMKKCTLLDILNYHLVYDAGRATSVMPTHLVAFLMMKKFRHGVDLGRLKTELKWLIDQVNEKKKDFGFYCRDVDMESIVFRAVEFLPDAINYEWHNDKKTFYFTPRQDLISLRKLEYYANYLLPDFMMEAVIATAIFAMSGTSLLMLRGTNKEIKIKDGVFMMHCKKVYEVLTGGFLLHAPCVSSESAIRRQVSQMVDYGRLILVVPDTRRYAWEHEADYDDFDDEPMGADNPATLEDPDFAFLPDEVKIIPSEKNFQHFSFLRNLVMPYFEIYAFLMPCLGVMLEKEGFSEDTLTLEKYLLEKLTEKIETNFKHCSELCTRDTVNQFLFTCVEHGILDMDTEIGSMNRVYVLLKESHELQKQADSILYYVTA